MWCMRKYNSHSYGIAQNVTHQGVEGEVFRQIVRMWRANVFVPKILHLFNRLCNILTTSTFKIQGRSVVDGMVRGI